MTTETRARVHRVNKLFHRREKRFHRIFLTPAVALRKLIHMNNDFILETSGLTHHFGGATALDDVAFQVEQGSIYGFLGPNGAGKTTTLRLTLGLLKKQSGRITIFGSDFGQDPRAALRRIGSLIETPSIYGHLTAVENLRVHQIVRGCARSRIDEVLKIVGLQNTRTKRSTNFSLGMKQRLGIAVALLHEPELLILDEPTNGLDPNGILEIRELIQTLNRDFGTTIIVSSHMLTEVERLVSHVGIINRGRMRFQGTIDELLAEIRRSENVIFQVGERERAVELLNINRFKTTVAADGIAVAISRDPEIAAVNRLLVGNGVDVVGISRGGRGLEDAFFQFIGEE